MVRHYAEWLAYKDKEDFLVVSSSMKRIVYVLTQVHLLYVGGRKSARATVGIWKQACKRQEKTIITRENNLQMFVNNIENY